MRVDLVTGIKHQGEAMRCLKEGLKRHGEDVRIVEGSPGADVVACWGWRKASSVKRPGRRVLVMERGYVGDRIEWTSLAWDGLNGRGRVPEVTDGGRRWLRNFGALLWPWRRDGRYVVVMGQVPGDMSLAGTNIEAWYGRAFEACQRFGEVVFRPHPVCVERGYQVGRKSFPGTLSQALSDARCVVTFNSNAGVDAVLAGVPVIACDEGSMVWDVAAHGLEAELVMPDRSEWCARIAWRQWRREEIEVGDSWDYLKEYLK